MMLLRGAFLLAILAAAFCSQFPQDPYATLGLRKGASVRDIKKAYKSLAREWHPDKNDNPEAGEKFMSINKAYEVLSDPIRKERYDKYGALDDSPQGHDYHHYGGFDSFFGGGFGGFERQDSFFNKHRISMRLYSHTILEKSHQQPFILFAYSGYCQLCYRVEPIWQAVVEDLEPLGYGVGTINAMTDGNLLEKLRVTHLPSIMVLVEGRVIHYRGSLTHLSAKSVRVWARDVLPHHFLPSLNTHDKLKRFVDQWKTTNKVSVLILGATPEPRLRYLLTAMKYSPTARFYYVHLGDSNSEVHEMREALSIKCTQCENVLIFNDVPERGPIARLSISHVNQLMPESLSTLLDQNKFLTLPRLSSNVYLDELCPVSSRNPRRLCAVLVAMEGSDDRYIDSYRQFIMERKTRLNADKITLSYIYANQQTEWLKPFLERRTGNAENHARDILVMWRYEHVKARFVWLKGVWKESGADAALDSIFSELLRNSLKLDEMAAVGNLKDEYSPSWWTKMSRAIIRMLETLWFHATKEETLPVLSVFGTLLCIFLAYYALNYMTRVEPKEKRRFSPANSNEWHPDDPNTTDKQALHTDGKKDPSQKTKKALSVMEPLMHELRAESYYGMVRLLKPGCRSVILLVDEENRQPLLEQFARYIYPLRNNKTFSFGYLMVEKNLPWFRKLLEHTLPLGEEEKAETSIASSSGKAASMYERLKTINPRQTIGTVLVLCGWKLYFSIYHPMHTTPNKKHFLGFDDDGEEASDYMTSDNDDDDDNTSTSMRRSFKGVNVQNVLNGFGNWLDRLLEGSIRRYYIPEWPDNLK